MLFDSLKIIFQLSELNKATFESLKTIFHLSELNNNSHSFKTFNFNETTNMSLEISFFGHPSFLIEKPHVL